MTDIYYDPFDFDVDTRAHDIWARMRDEAPLYRNDAHNFWALTRYDDVLECLLDTDTYVSRFGTTLDLMNDEAMMATGASLFVSKCAQCHGNKGEGNIGPNLTDTYWLHGGKLTDIYHTVTEGVPSKGMLAWKNQLGPAEILSVSAFVGSLRDSNPSPAKEPQGKAFEYDVEAILAEEAVAAETDAVEGEAESEATETQTEAASSSD